MHRGLTTLRVAALAPLVLATPLRAGESLPDFPPAGTAQVSAVEGDATLGLADGRKLRLAGIDLPLRGAAERAAKQALSAMTLGHRIELRSAGAPRDRQGRVLAQIFTGAMWVQGELLQRGLARVHSTADDRLGVGAMLQLERQARRYRRGLWADRAYAIIDAAEAGKFAGSFQLATGIVLEAEKTGRGTVLRFGAADSPALAAVLDARALKLCEEAGLDPLALEGKRLLLRGYIDSARRPVMAITHPEQIEILRRKKTAPAHAPEP